MLCSRHRWAELQAINTYDYCRVEWPGSDIHSHCTVKPDVSLLLVFFQCEGVSVCCTSSSSFNSCRALSEQDSAPSTGKLSHCTRASPGSVLRPPSSPAACLRPAALSFDAAGLKTTSHSSERSPETLHMARRSSNTCKQHTHTHHNDTVVRIIHH